MTTAESPSPTTSIEAILQKRRKKQPYDVVPTRIEGVSLRAEAGTDLDILRKTIGRLAVASAEYAVRKSQLGELAEKQKIPEKEIKGIAMVTEGLRGIQSEPGNFILDVFPRSSVTWNREVLKESLGMAYSSVVSEDLGATVSIPNGFETNQGPLTVELMQAALIKGLVDLGLPEAELSMIINPEVILSVNEARLADLITTGRVQLLEGAASVTETWAITVDPLKKTQVGGDTEA
ncbi:MAG: hypothetical protein ABI602_02340 [Candidatus Saccharibacteria bacterium]